MPSTKRDRLKRKLGQVVFNIDTCLGDLKDVHDEFKDVHPDLAEGLEVAIRLLIHSQDCVGIFSEKCWHTDAETLKQYR